jgi:hypothetical protein
MLELAPDFVQKIDWKMLRKQKKDLLKVINNDSVSPKEKESLEGIMSLIDHIQDYAVDTCELSERKVFGKL